MKTSAKYIKFGVLTAFVFLIVCGIIGITTIDTINVKNEIAVSIAKGSGAKSIAKVLKEKKIIKSKFAFVQYIKKQNASENLRPGNYKFGPGNISFDDILQKLKKGAVNEDSISITVPEGYTVSETADILEAKGLVEKEIFLAYIGKMEPPYEYISKGIDYKQLEGFLFPETYFIPLSWNEKEIVNMMLKQFDKVWTDEYQKRAEELKLSVKEVITIASLIEREAVLDSERKLISSVIYNRLKIGMPLQIDATIQYLLPEQKEKLLYKDLEIDSPYNTYKNKGLPPGPIASPGKASIEAALYPEKTDYLYYRAKVVGNGEHYFTKTFDEHKSYKGK